MDKEGNKSAVEYVVRVRTGRSQQAKPPAEGDSTSSQQHEVEDAREGFQNIVQQVRERVYGTSAFIADTFAVSNAPFARCSIHIDHVGNHHMFKYHHHKIRNKDYFYKLMCRFAMGVDEQTLYTGWNTWCSNHEEGLRVEEEVRAGLSMGRRCCCQRFPRF